MSGAHRSAGWSGEQGRNGVISRSWTKDQGFPDGVFDGRSVICTSWSAQRGPD